MKYEKHIETQWRCDFCKFLGKTEETNYILPYNYSRVVEGTKRPEVYRWFMVLASGAKKGELHACKNCGHLLEQLLNLLGIEHGFHCTEYANADAWGTISLSNQDNKNNITPDNPDLKELLN